MQSSNDHEKPDQDLKGEDKISWVEVKKFVEEKKIEQAECIFLRKPNSEVEIPSKERKNEDEKERLCEPHGLAISEHIRSRNAKRDDSPECDTDWTTTKCYGQTYNSSSPENRDRR
ncbi:uncharacterized protein LOC135488889 isoform X2 [Lineus longissimus]|uniref:uncharacterized protein LOC135488889 isoform X2 n=1 Tax=Lineus longissimus TaxID=88925 RepID=UPI00315D3559